MARIAVTDGMSDEAVEILENAGHEVVSVSYTHLTLPTTDRV